MFPNQMFVYVAFWKLDDLVVISILTSLIFYRFPSNFLDCVVDNKLLYYLWCVLVLRVTSCDYFIATLGNSGGVEIRFLGSSDLPP